MLEMEATLGRRCLATRRQFNMRIRGGGSVLIKSAVGDRYLCTGKSPLMRTGQHTKCLLQVDDDGYLRVGSNYLDARQVASAHTVTLVPSKTPQLRVVDSFIRKGSQALDIWDAEEPVLVLHTHNSHDSDQRPSPAQPRADPART